MPEASSLLSGLKVDLGIATTAFDERLTVYIQTAQARITEEGVTLTNSVDDSLLTTQYAAWMWRKRDTGEGMPRMVRYALNNLILSQKGGSDE